MQNWYVNRWNRCQLNLPCEHQWHTFDDRVWKKHILSIKAAGQEVWIVVWLMGNTCYVSKKNKWSCAWHKWRNHNSVTVKVGKKVFQWQVKRWVMMFSFSLKKGSIAFLVPLHLPFTWWLLKVWFMIQTCIWLKELYVSQVYQMGMFTLWIELLLPCLNDPTDNQQIYAFAEK